ncbi:amidohydrolase [Solicola gregarius]|uniref:Amidohydrolase n=1 Tax=Solicola gregarius TaxID=2908642 RepID=A0AA46TEC1_9ACTN|nr:amidohydrolase [Solicola gregarius]UYM03486.1 amidohydrolase [Solicola gregarius]
MTQRPSAVTLAVIDADVRTLDPSLPRAEAIAIAGSEIVAVGTTSEIRDLAAAGTQVVSLRGATVTPGLIDSHIHPVWGADLTTGIDLDGLADLDAVRDAVRTEAERVHARGDGSWIRGWNLDYAAFDGTTIRGDLLEDAALGLPAAFTFYDLHTAVGTRAALEQAGIDRERAFTDASCIVVDAAGVPTGELREPTAYNLLLDAAPAATHAHGLARVRSVLEGLASVGLTGGVVMDGTPATLDLLAELERDAPLPVRLDVALWHGPGRDDDGVAEYVALRDAAGARWSCGLIKLFSDGVIDTGTAWLYEPDSCGHGLDSFWPDPQRYVDVVQAYHDAGFQIATHAVGDKAVGAVLDAYEKAGPRANGRAPHRIEHLETVTDDDVARMAAAGVTASMQPLHMQWRRPDGSDSWAIRLGAERTDRAFRITDLIRAGAPVTLGSDWPVAQSDPRIGMAWARGRRTPGEPDAPVFEPDQALSPEQALDGYTAWGAAALGDGRRGRVAPGCRADLTAFAGDPIASSSDELVDLPITMTVVDGQISHRAEQ